MLKVKKVRPRSLTEKCGVLPGDELQKINSRPIRDIIDFCFYSADDNLRLCFRRRGGLKTFRIGKRTRDLGLTFYPDRIKGCGSRCIFCFVDQLPRGLRKSLYFKDEDFRLSFLKGNFITLTNTSGKDINRIITQRLSPLYISVHTVKEELRKKMLDNPKTPQILPLIRKLTDGRIELHTQIVLCPGINDGEYLEESIEALSNFYPYVRSIAIVPVGLTKFRKGLFTVKAVNKAVALKTIRSVRKYQSDFQKKYRCNLVYLADEFFLLAGLDIPHAKYYDEFWQIENGVGLLRKFLDDFKKDKGKLPLTLKRKLHLTLITGSLAYSYIKKVADKLNQIKNLKVSAVAVENRFLGKSVTVSGLLAGKDIISSLKQRKDSGQAVILPPDCLNYQGRFLDDLRIMDMEKSIKRKILLGSYNIVNTILKAIKHNSICPNR